MCTVYLFVLFQADYFSSVTFVTEMQGLFEQVGYRCDEPVARGTLARDRSLG